MLRRSFFLRVALDWAFEFPSAWELRLTVEGLTSCLSCNVLKGAYCKNPSASWVLVFLMVLSALKPKCDLCMHPTSSKAAPMR